jgi:hypothetical protein
VAEISHPVADGNDIVYEYEYKLIEGVMPAAAAQPPY